MFRCRAKERGIDMKDNIRILASAIILAGVFIIGSCWKDKHILAPLAIFGGALCVITGLVLFISSIVN